jgi:hypothetical protein
VPSDVSFRSATSFSIAANQEFLDEQPRHDGLAGARIVSEEESQRLTR